jgi:hypothetical protein
MLAGRLAAIGEARRLAYAMSGDAFRPADLWLATLAPPEPKAAAADAAKSSAAPATRPARPKVDHAAVFRSNHSLSAIMNVHGGGMALVNGRIYAPGQACDGFRLTSVGLASATFTGKGTTVTLRLPGAPAGRAGRSGSAVADAR